MERDTEQEGLATLAPGRQRWHSSEEDGGPDVGIEIGMPDGSTLWVGEISTKLWETVGGGVLAPDAGWWMVHYPNDREARVVGPVLSTWYDYDGADCLSAALSSQGSTPEGDGEEAGLIQRLRAGCACSRCKVDACCCAVMDEAADRLEALTAMSQGSAVEAVEGGQDDG